jgi:arylsulfatase A-like enzyme
MTGALENAVVRTALLVMIGVSVALSAPGVAGAAPHASAAGGLIADSSRPRGAVTDHVIVVSIDGLRADAIEHYGLETLQRLIKGGSYALDASTILPSKTLPSHTSMLTGRVPEAHGILFNSEREDQGIVEVPTIFELARARGFHTAAFFSKAKLRHLDRPNSYDHRSAPASNMDNWMVTRTVPEALQYLRHRRPNLLFVHIGEPDYAGHTAGWMGFFYGVAARRADAGVGRLLEQAEETYGAGNFTILVTADHGGHDHDHGSDHPMDTTIPWIIYGEGVRPGPAPEGIRTMDTAATALWLLGVSLPVEAEGRVVTAAFSGEAILAALPTTRETGSRALGSGGS